MNSKVVLVLVVVLAVSLVPESQAFTAGGGGNIPHGKREMLSVSIDRPTPRLYSLHLYHYVTELFVTRGTIARQVRKKKTFCVEKV